MKKIKIVVAFVMCLFIAGSAMAQSSAADYVSSLDKRVSLTANQRTSVTSLYTKLLSDMEAMSSVAERSAAKSQFKADLNALLTSAQRAKLNARLTGR